MDVGAVQFDRMEGSTTLPAAFGLLDASASASSTSASTVTVTTTEIATARVTIGAAHDNKKRAAAIGAGIGVPLLTALLVALGLLWSQGRQLKQLRSQSKQDSMSQAYKYGMPPPQYPPELNPEHGISEMTDESRRHELPSPARV